MKRALLVLGLLGINAAAADCAFSMPRVGWLMILGGRSAPFTVTISSEALDEVKVSWLGFGERTSNEFLYPVGDSFYWMDAENDYHSTRVTYGDKFSRYSRELEFVMDEVTWSASRGPISQGEALYFKVQGFKSGQTCRPRILVFFNLKNFY